MPVFPLVGSMMVVVLLMRPLCSASRIMATPILSFTREQGLKNSSFPTREPAQPADTFFSFTRGVRPTSSGISSAILIDVSLRDAAYPFKVLQNHGGVKERALPDSLGNERFLHLPCPVAICARAGRAGMENGGDPDTPCG